MFRPSSMPITEKIQEDTRFNEQNWDIAIRQQVNKMDDAIYQYVKKSIAFTLDKSKRLSSYDIRKQITVGCGPLFHVIASPNKLFYSLDDAADEELYCSVDGVNLLCWRHMLNPSVIGESKRVTVIDKSWIQYVVLLCVAIVGVLAYLQYRQCSGIYDKMQLYDFFEDDYQECSVKQRNLIYAIVGLFAVWAYLRSLQKRRHTNRMKEQRKYLQDQLLSAKKQE